MHADIDRLESLIDAGELDAARRMADAFERPADANSIWRLARLLDLQLGRAEDAERLYRAASPASPDAVVDLSLMLEDQGRDEEADAELRSLSAAAEAAARVTRGRHYRANNCITRALLEYERGVELKDMVALHYLAGTLSHLGRYAAAEQLYLHAPLGADDQLSLDYADFLRDRDRDEEAEALLARLAARDVAVAERTLADVISENPERADEAISHYLAAIMLGDAMAVTNLGVEWAEQGRDQEAHYALRHAWEDGDSLAGHSLSKLLIRAGDHDQGETVLGDAPLALAPLSVPMAWRACAADLLRCDRVSSTAPVADWVTLLQAAQLSHLREGGASPREIDEHLRRARWTSDDGLHPSSA